MRYIPRYSLQSGCTPLAAASRRCFEHVTLCKVKDRMEGALCKAGQRLLAHYRPLLPPISDAFHPMDDEDALKVCVCGGGDG